MDPSLILLLVICLSAACLFEFINGFHDTANAVAAVIYTRSLKPKVAVLMAGVLNFVGVYIGGIAVAMGIISLLPSEMLTMGGMSSVAMIMAILIAAIVWNLGTWYLGLPCSSSHTLIGSILGAAWAFSLTPEGASTAPNWQKAFDVLTSLLITPIVGFALAWIMLKILKALLKDDKYYQQPKEGKKPPFWTRTMLILTSGGVSLAHGSNDGQKGVGLVMLILVALLPAHFALKASDAPATMKNDVIALESSLKALPAQQDEEVASKLKKASEKLAKVEAELGTLANGQEIPENARGAIRANLMSSTKAIDKALKGDLQASDEAKAQVKSQVKALKGNIEFAPSWVLIMISLSLGIGTMFGWKRIVKTVGEKIGKAHFSYGHGISTSLMSAMTIGASTGLGLPVSTTHIVSSSVAGGMSATGGIKNLQGGTIRNMLIAWILTLPASILLSAGLYLALSNGLK